MIEQSIHDLIDLLDHGYCSITVFRTVQSVRPGGRTGRTAGGSPSFFESKDGLWDMEVGPDALGAR